MVIVMIIIWILVVVLTESYLTISKISLKVEQEKNLSEESLILTQVFQAISDEATIDYEKYNNKLIESKWFTNILYLTWWQWTWTAIYTTGESCIELDWNFSLNNDSDKPTYSNQEALLWCSLVIDKDWEITPLTTQWKVIISKAIFRIIPYDSDKNYFNSSEWNAINNIHQPAFWLFTHLYAPLYQTIWTNKIDQPLQLFFNLNV